ncbi:MAG: hypothetical protein ACOCUL_01940 [Bacteroidota bacterium]
MKTYEIRIDKGVIETCIELYANFYEFSFGNNFFSISSILTKEILMHDLIRYFKIFVC